MKKILHHSWPVLVLFVSQFVQFYATAFFNIVESVYIDRFLPDFPVMSSLVAIYYLYSSPFTREQSLSLSILIVLRFINSELLGLGLFYRGIVEIGLEILIVVLYILRTKDKEIVRLGDKAKAYILATYFIFSVINTLITIIKTSEAGQDFMFYLEETQLGIVTQFYGILAFFLGLSFTIIHVIMLYKWSSKHNKMDQDLLIDQIGQ